MTQLTDQRVRSNTTDRTIEAALTNLDIAPPSIQRHQTPDLDAEGLRLDSLASSLGAPEPLTMSAGSNEKQSSSDSVSAQNRPVRREVEPTASLENGECAATGTVEGEEAPEGIDAGFAALERRLEAIERAVSGERVPATVVDAGDGVFAPAVGAAGRPGARTRSVGDDHARWCFRRSGVTVVFRRGSVNGGRTGGSYSTVSSARSSFLRASHSAMIADASLTTARIVLMTVRPASLETREGATMCVPRPAGLGH